MTGQGDGVAATPARGAALGALGSHTILYLVGTALQGLGILLILPFATRLLGEAEYGKVATALVVIQMVGTIAAAGLPQVILREYHRGADGPTAGRALAGTMTLLAVAVAVLGVVIGAVLAAAGRVDLREWSLVVVASAALTTVVAGQSLSRARLRPLEFLALAVAATVIAHLAGLLAARGDRAGLTYLTAYTAALVLAAVLAIAIGRPLLPSAARQRTRAGVRLAAPLLPQALAMLGLLMGDVLLVNVLLGTPAAGAYQVALQLANIPFVLAVALFNAWGPLVLSHPVEDRWRWTARTGTSLVVVVGVGAAGVALLGPWLVHLMAPGFPQRSMSVSLGIITIVSVAYMVYQGASLAVLDHEHTVRLALAAAIALVVLVAAAVWLNGPAGIAGVAAAKAVAYVVLMAVTVHAARTLTPLRFVPWLWVAGAAAAALSLAGALLPSTGTGAVVRLVLVVALGGVALVLAPRVLRSMRG
ncbi:MAG TPA: oligosaccharide flippase family protein [Intrasporangium sp.]|uniref:lipopolysaccharide biosynthesis protein n=1 Tax=Intrasporangium sp. TaxID=1925024 RepID=UPI002B47C8FD|nr:oligosaccharide flippase family protein [Intrasporangium sp.]HKX68356.1 oligosaccharide flippase family protein [Intrasporangium sp.]